jgi:hypothetical protein
MQTTTMSGAAGCRAKGPFRFLVICLLACCALATAAVASTDAAKPPTAPSPGKALVCLYRPSKFIGSASHDNLYVNGTLLATLLNGEYACTEVAPGTVVVSGLQKAYYAGAIMSSVAALDDVKKKENERARIEVEAGKSYYLKWSSEAMGANIKLILQDSSVGAKEMSKLHPSKPPEDKDAGKDAGK